MPLLNVNQTLLNPNNLWFMFASEELVHRHLRFLSNPIQALLVHPNLPPARTTLISMLTSDPSKRSTIPYEHELMYSLSMPPFVTLFRLSLIHI